MTISLKQWEHLEPSGPGTIHPRWLYGVMIGASFLFVSSAFFSIAVNSLSLGLMGICFAAFLIIRRGGILRATPLDVFFLAYILAEYVATIFSINPLQSLEFSKRVLLIGIVYFFATWVKSERLARQTVAVLLGTATLVSLIGVAKLALGGPNDNTRLGIFQFYMTTSELMMITVLLLMPFALHPATPRKVRWVASLSLIPVLICLYATVTRGAYLAAAAGLLFIALMRNRKLIVPFVVVITMTILFAPPYVESRIRSIVDLQHPENASRLMLWKTGLRIFEAHPVIGVGDIDLHEIYLKYMDPGDPAQHGHMHNVAVQILVTLGALGFAAFVAMFVQIWRVMWRVFRKFRQEWFKGSFALGALAVFIGFQVNGLTEWSFGDQEVVILLWITLGITMGLNNVEPIAGRKEL